MKAIDVLKKLSDRNISVMDGTQLVVSLGDINDTIAELDLMACESCKLQYDRYCPISEVNHDFKYCSEWRGK